MICICGTYISTQKWVPPFGCSKQLHQYSDCWAVGSWGKGVHPDKGCRAVLVSGVNCSVIVRINTDFSFFFVAFVNSSNFLLNQLIWRKGLKAWLTESIWKGTRATLKYTIIWHSIFYLILHFKVSFCFFFKF